MWRSVPIFMVWVLTMLPAVFAVDAVLRVYAQTRFLLVMNLVRFAFVAGLIGWFLSSFGLMGAVLVTLLATDGDQGTRRRPHRAADAASACARRCRGGAWPGSPPSRCCRPSRSLAASDRRVASACHVHRRRGALRRDVPAALLHRLAAALASSHTAQVTSHKSQAAILEPGA